MVAARRTPVGEGSSKIGYNVVLAMSEKSTVWILQQVPHPKFPYRLSLVKGEETLLSLRVSDRWPGGKGSIFCLRDEERDWPKPEEELERVPIVSLRRYGRRLSVCLDRPTRRRCDFLFLKKNYKHKPGEYEQIFWQTQKGMRERRPRVRFTVPEATGLHVWIDSSERYPWQFPGCKVQRHPLPAGDYALLEEGDIAALIERKTLDNLLRDLSDLRILHQKLGELAAYPLAALLVEAEYADFLKPDKTKPLGVRYCVRALAEVAVLHPRLIVQFAGTRKLGNAWARAFFAAAAGYAKDRSPGAVREAMAAYGRGETARGGFELRVRKMVLQEFPAEFPLQALRDAFPEASDAALRRVLGKMRERGELDCRGRGRAAQWGKTAPP